MKWTLAFLVGLLTGLIATLINLAIENIAGYKLLAVFQFIENERFCNILTFLLSLLSILTMAGDDPDDLFLLCGAGI